MSGGQNPCHEPAPRGHLSHGHRASITSKCFTFSHYEVDTGTELINYENIRRIAEKFRPKMIVAGASSYPRLIDYEQMAKIAKDVSAYLFADMAHIGGLVAAKVIPSPVPHCDFVTFTCYKTMMGGRRGVILCKEAYGEKIDKAVFPGCQGTTAAISTRRMGTAEVKKIAELIDGALINAKTREVLDQVAQKVAQLCKAFPVYG